MRYYEWNNLYISNCLVEKLFFFLGSLVRLILKKKEKEKVRFDDAIRANEFERLNDRGGYTKNEREIINLFLFC